MDEIVEIAKTIACDIEVIVHRNQHTLVLKNKAQITPLLAELKNNPASLFDMLTDITAIDWAKTENRFEVVYFLYSCKYKRRLSVKLPVDIEDCNCPTATAIYPSADWYERETYDMYGIKFTNHPDLRRFYMPEDFFDKKTLEAYHPLRKDFPLMGFPGELPLPPYPEKTGNEIEW